MKKKKLKPCPFCGGKADFLIGSEGNGGEWHYVECIECQSSGPYVNYADHNIAIKDALSFAWDTRAIDPAAIREAALREAADVVHKWWFGDGNELPQELILELIGEKK
jgi:hypothetical protein